MREIDPEAAALFIIKNASRFGEAKSHRMYCEEHRKTKKALLMNESNGKTVSEREQYAYSHPEYVKVLQEFKEAALVEETLRLQIRGAELEIEIWRTRQANNRNQDRVMR